jgi:hypothetical protein
MTPVCEWLLAWEVPAIVLPRPAPSSVDDVFVEGVPPGRPSLYPQTRSSGDVGHARATRNHSGPERTHQTHAPNVTR